MSANPTSFFADKQAAERNQNRIQLEQNISEKKAYQFGDMATHKDVQLLNTCLADFNQASARLKAIDARAALSFTAALTSFGLAFIAPIMPFAVGAGIVAFGYGCYQLGLRQKAYQDYLSSMNNMVLSCRWLLKEVAESNVDAVLNDVRVQEIVKALIPVMTQAQLDPEIDDNVENKLKAQAKEARDDESSREQLSQVRAFLRGSLQSQQATIHYSIYGLGQGSARDFFGAIWTCIRNGFVSGWNHMTGHSDADDPDRRPLAPTEAPVAEQTLFASAGGESPKVLAKPTKPVEDGGDIGHDSMPKIEPAATPLGAKG